MSGGSGSASSVVAGLHLAHFYSDEPELAVAAGRYLSDALRADAVAVVLATTDHQRAFELELRRAGIDVAAARAAGSCVTYDARKALRRVMVDGSADRDRFKALLREIIGPVAARGRRLMVYGDVCGLLCEARMFPDALAFEDLVNELVAGLNVTVLCGYYRSWSLSDGGELEAVRQLCLRHTHLTSLPFTT